MKPVNFMLILLFSFLITESSFVCFGPPKKTVAIDSIHYFKPNKILLTANDFTDSAISLKLHNGHYNFIKKTSKGYTLFMADKDGNNVYVLTSIIPSVINDTAIVATVQYQAFDKMKQITSSKVFRLKNITLPLSTIKSFKVDYGHSEIPPND